MINIECPECGECFSKTKLPKVLPCGHSMCSTCTFSSVEMKGYYHCKYLHYKGRTCVEKFEPSLIPALPTNILYFDMLEKVEKFIRQKEWEQGLGKDNDETFAATTLRIEEQCLYTFCQRKRFERDGIIELYCSQECKQNNEELEEFA